MTFKTRRSVRWLGILSMGLLTLGCLESKALALNTDSSDIETSQQKVIDENALAVSETSMEVKAKPIKEGSAESGYRTTTAAVGPLGEKKILDTPYNVQSLSGEMIENRQATSFREMVQYLPSAQIEERGGPDVGRPQTRGFQGTVVENNRLDGMNMVATTALPMEMFERIDVLNGISGSLYGPANPSGTFNFVLKRPTDDPIRQVNLKYNSDGNVTGHLDVGDRIGPNDRFGYRINVLYGDGEGYVDDSTLRRKMASLALDWHVFDHTVIEANFSYYRFIKKALQAALACQPALNCPMPWMQRAPATVRIGPGRIWKPSPHAVASNTTSTKTGI